MKIIAATFPDTEPVKKTMLFKDVSAMDKYSVGSSWFKKLVQIHRRLFIP